MANPFAADTIAAGYATARPPVHPRILERAFDHLERRRAFDRALDLGCGAGVSTKALLPFANRCVGVEPAASMLKWVADIAPGADFIVGRAEAIPLRDRSVDLITAAGSLNYSDVDLALREAARILVEGGVLVVYDFSPGRNFADNGSLDEWFARFIARYPPPAKEGRELSPEILAQFDSGLRMQSHEDVEIGIELTRGFYLDYILTETNVAAAMREGVPANEIRSWCAETLEPVWQGRNREVVFPGYFACMIKTGGE
jgi:ubiquinone/menaquinone biosynthesis C-methylase UbiE